MKSKCLDINTRSEVVVITQIIQLTLHLSIFIGIEKYWTFVYEKIYLCVFIAGDTAITNKFY